MIEPIMKIKLNKNQYSSLCYLVNHNEKENSYVTDVNEAFSRCKFFMTNRDMQESIKNKVNYILFTREE